MTSVRNFIAGFKRIYTYDAFGRAKPISWWKYPLIWIWELRK